MAFMYLGSDGVIKFRRPAGSGGERVKQGQITVQTGDLVGVQTGADGLDVIAHQDGFGFRESQPRRRPNEADCLVCIGRQIYRLDQEPVAESASPHATIADRNVLAQSRRLPNPPPPRPTKLPHVPLTFWYVGPFPLDPERPLKLQPSMRVKPSDITMPIRENEADPEEPKMYTGIEEDDDLAPSTVLAPPAINGGRKRKPADQATSAEVEGEKDKGKGKAAKGEKAEKGKGGVKGLVESETKSGDSSPVKKKSRKSGGVKA